MAARQGELDWVGRLRRALDDGRFCLYAQEMVGVSGARKGERHQELLLRMIDDEQQVIDPIVFIPVAERYNLMPAVDRLVISTAFAEFARMVEARGAGRHAPMGDQPVGRVFEPGRFSGVRSQAVRPSSASLTP